MRRRFHLTCLIGLCIVGGGAQWDLLQVFAWGRMITDYSRTMSVAAAVHETFAGKMCPLCRVVAAGRKQEARNTPAAAGHEIKLLLLCQTPAPVLLAPPPLAAWRRAATPLKLTLALAPPVPPPRRVLA